MTLRMGQSEPLRMGLRKPQGMGMPYSLLLTPFSYLPSPPWFRNLYLTRATPTDEQQKESTP